jgi:hypothetical protein
MGTYASIGIAASYFADNVYHAVLSESEYVTKLCFHSILLGL